MPGLVPDIRVFASTQKEDVDGRHKAGHDGRWADSKGRFALSRFRPVQRIDRNDADRARYAGADLAVVALLLVAEEHVAMVDLALDRNDIDGADAAFAALAIRYHLEAGAVQRVQHRAVLRHDEFGVAALQAHAEFGRRLQPAGAEGLVAQIGRRASSVIPG